MSFLADFALFRIGGSLGTGWSKKPIRSLVK